MQYYSTVWSVAAYVENRLEGPFDYEAMARQMGFSLAHLRDVYQRTTGTTLNRYVTERKIAHAAFALVHTEESILSIALRYGFTNPDTFTRVFRRVAGMNPQDFRRRRMPVGRKILAAGVFGVCVHKP